MANIKFHLLLTKIAGTDEMKLQLDGPSPLPELLAKAGIKTDDVGMVIKNGKWAPPYCLVEDRDQVEVFPILEGG